MTLIVAAGVCLVATMFFSAAEMAFIAANRAKLQHLAEEGHSGARRYLESFRQPERFLSTVMLGATLAQIIASSAATSGLLPYLGGRAPVAVTPARRRLRCRRPSRRPGRPSTRAVYRVRSR